MTISGTELFLYRRKINSGTKSIIDNILIWSSNVPTILLYLDYVCRVFQKYRVSFRLDKCQFIESRVEFLDCDLIAHGNCPVHTKFEIICDWDIPLTGQSLHSFIGLIIFYCTYAPYLEMRIKSLRKLNKDYFRSPIPQMTWTPELLQLFNDIQVSITYSPILSRYNPSKPTFLKMDWSAEGMGWILM